MVRPVTDADVAAVDGWFGPVDVALFRFFLGHQVEQGQRGDLAEIGVFRGRSAILVGSYQQPGESFTVADLFVGARGAHKAPMPSAEKKYVGFNRETFERTYHSVHGELPQVVHGPSSTLRGTAREGTHRFVHVDGSHVYDDVVVDLETARALVGPEGVVAVDDYRTAHTPGVAAATWEAVLGGFHPIVVTESKLYGTWGDAGVWRAALVGWLTTSPLASEVVPVAGADLVRVWSPAGRGWRAGVRRLAGSVTGR